MVLRALGLNSEGCLSESTWQMDSTPGCVGQDGLDSGDSPSVLACFCLDSPLPLVWTALRSGGAVWPLSPREFADCQGFGSLQRAKPCL